MAKSTAVDASPFSFPSNTEFTSLSAVSSSYPAFSRSSKSSIISSLSSLASLPEPIPSTIPINSWPSINSVQEKLSPEMVSPVFVIPLVPCKTIKLGSSTKP